MELIFAPKGILQIDDAKLIYRNFSGAPSQYNRAGDRNFSVIIPTTEMADALTEQGWNVKVKPPREEGEEPFMYLTVKVKFNDRGPAVYLQSGRNMRKLNENTVGRLDRVDIISADLDIRPYHYDVNGKTGISAYLQSIKVTQDVDRFAADVEEDYEEE